MPRARFAGLPMSIRAIDSRAFGALAAILVLFALRLGLALLSVPPWQHPDEPQHVMAVWARTAPDVSADAVATMERKVIASMTRHRWWDRVGAPQPASPALRFADDPELVRRHVMLPRSDGLYYGAAATFVHQLDPEQILWSARAFSVASAMGTLVLAFAFGRALMGAWAGVGVAAILALHPQYALVATAASGDAFVGLLSAGVLWSAAEGLRSARAPMWLALAVAFAVAAMLSRRLGFTVALVAAWAILVTLTSRGSREALRLGAGAALALALAGAGLLWSGGDTLRHTIGELRTITQVRPAQFDLWAGLAGLQQSSWLTAGWLTSAPGPSWRVVFAGLTACALLAPAMAWIQSRPMLARGAALLAGGAVALQVGALLTRQFLVGEMSQGRYLSPVAVALAALLWAGVAGAVPRRWQPAAAAGLVGLMAAIDAAAWAQVVVPAFS